MLAAEERAVLLQPVADDVDTAIFAGRRQRVDGALEAIERVGRAVQRHLKGLIVVVAACPASHGRLASVGWISALLTRGGAPGFRPCPGSAAHHYVLRCARDTGGARCAVGDVAVTSPAARRLSAVRSGCRRRIPAPALPEPSCRDRAWPRRRRELRPSNVRREGQGTCSD